MNVEREKRCGDGALFIVYCLQLVFMVLIGLGRRVLGFVRGFVVDYSKLKKSSLAVFCNGCICRTTTWYVPVYAVKCLLLAVYY